MKIKFIDTFVFVWSICLIVEGFQNKVPGDWYSVVEIMVGITVTAMKLRDILNSK